MKNNKLYIVILALIVCIVVETVVLVKGTLTKVAKNAHGEDILVSLNDGTNITVNDIWNELKDSYALSSILTMTDNKILTTEYESRLEEVNKYAKDVETNLKANYVDENGKYDEATLIETLQNYGYKDINAYLEQVKLSELTSFATKDYAKTLVTDKELKEYYEKNTYPNVKALHILVKPASTSDDDLKAAKEKAEGIIKTIKEEVNKGSSYEEVFRKYEDNSEVTFEDLGSFNYKQMEESFSKAAYALKNYEMSSSPTKTSYGYHVILKLDEEEKKPLDEVKDDLLSTLAEEKMSNDSTLETKAMEALRKKYDFKINDSSINENYNRYINRSLQKTNN